MKLMYSGKTKDVFQNPSGTYTLKLKDDATGRDGVFDPGENAVGLCIEGLGKESLKLTAYFFELLTENGIPHHFISHDVESASMEVVPNKLFGEGLEFLCRLKADGSFIKRYGSYASFGSDLGCLVETTLKDDFRQDPPITQDTLAVLGIMTPREYECCKEFTKKAAGIIAQDLKTKNLSLHDIKFEFGTKDDCVMLIDEISAGCMRVYKDGKKVAPMDLGKLVLQSP